MANQQSAASREANQQSLIEIFLFVCFRLMFVCWDLFWSPISFLSFLGFEDLCERGDTAQKQQDLLIPRVQLATQTNH